MPTPHIAEMRGPKADVLRASVEVVARGWASGRWIAGLAVLDDGITADCTVGFMGEEVAGVVSVLFQLSRQITVNELEGRPRQTRGVADTLGLRRETIRSGKQALVTRTAARIVRGNIATPEHPDNRAKPYQPSGSS